MREREENTREKFNLQVENSTLYTNIIIVSSSCSPLQHREFALLVSCSCSRYTIPTIYSSHHSLSFHDQMYLWNFFTPSCFVLSCFEILQPHTRVRIVRREKLLRFFLSLIHIISFVMSLAQSTSYTKTLFVHSFIDSARICIWKLKYWILSEKFRVAHQSEVSGAITSLKVQKALTNRTKSKNIFNWNKQQKTLECC